MAVFSVSSGREQAFPRVEEALGRAAHWCRNTFYNIMGGRNSTPASRTYSSRNFFTRQLILLRDSFSRLEISSYIKAQII